MRISDWSSDVCSSDLAVIAPCCIDLWPFEHVDRFVGIGVARLPDFLRREAQNRRDPAHQRVEQHVDRKSVVSGKRVSVRVDLGGRRIIKKKKTTELSYVSKSV